MATQRSVKHDSEALPDPRWHRALGTAVLVLLSGSLPLFLAGAVAPLMAVELGLTPVRLGLAVAAFNVVLATVALTSGHRVDVIGWRRALRVSAVASAVSLGGAAALASEWWVLAVFMGLGGAAHALAQAGANLAIVQLVSGRQRAFVFGIKQAAPVLAIAASGALLPLVAQRWGWRGTFALAAAAPLAALLAVRRLPAPVVADLGATTAPLRLRSTSGLVVLLACVGVIAGGVVTTLTSFFVSSAAAAGTSPAVAGMLLAVASLMGMGSRLWVGWLASARSLDPLKSMALMLAVGSLGFVLIGVGGTTFLAAGAVICFVVGYGWPGLFHFAVSTLDPRRAAGATGVAVFGLASGSLLGPVAFGLAVERRSYATAWFGVAGASLVAAALCRVAAKRRVTAAQIPAPGIDVTA